MGAGLFLRTIANLRDVDLGFVHEELVILDVHPQSAGNRGDAAIALTRWLLDRSTAMQGVASVSVSEHGVLTGRDSGTNLIRPRGFAAEPEGFPRTHRVVVGPRYFATRGASLLAGRDFTDHDDVGSAPHSSVFAEADTNSHVTIYRKEVGRASTAKSMCAGGCARDPRMAAQSC